MSGKSTRTLEERFWEKVNKKGPKQPHMKTRCWAWTAGLDAHGYGQINAGGHRIWKAHRTSWLLQKGDPGEFRVCHKCDNPACVRLSHLYLGTQLQNMRDKLRRGRGGTMYSLSREDVLRAKAWVDEGVPKGEIANRLGVSRVRVGQISRGESRFLR